MDIDENIERVVINRKQENITQAIEEINVARVKKINRFKYKEDPWSERVDINIIMKDGTIKSLKITINLGGWFSVIKDTDYFVRGIGFYAFDEYD